MQCSSGLEQTGSQWLVDRQAGWTGTVTGGGLGSGGSDVVCPQGGGETYSVDRGRRHPVDTGYKCDQCRYRV